MNAEESKTEVFDVFLCHNSEDKPAVREIAKRLVSEGIKPWLDEQQIRPGTSWQEALELQIESIKSAAVFVGGRGIGPWQNREIRAFLSQFVDRECPVIPAILPSAKATPKLPLLLKDIHYVDFRVAAPLDPLLQLIWGITGVKPSQQSDISSTDDSTLPLEADVKGLFPAKDKTEMELTIGEKNIDKFSRDEQAKLLIALSNALDLGFEIRLKRVTAGSIRLRLELNPEDADKIYAATQNGQLAALGSQSPHRSCSVSRSSKNRALIPGKYKGWSFDPM